MSRGLWLGLARTQRWEALLTWTGAVATWALMDLVSPWVSSLMGAALFWACSSLGRRLDRWAQMPYRIDLPNGGRLRISRSLTVEESARLGVDR